MKRPGPVLLLLALACGDVDEKAACSTSLDCPAGQWCAPADGERICWPDAVAPVASDVTIACDTTPCLRDGTLRIEAAVADDHEVLAAEARLDLDASRTIAMTRAGARWRADVPLRDFPFERFEGPVTAQVVGVDGARTRSAPVASPAVQVTRLRWEYTAPNALTSPAVMGDGTVVVGVAGASDQLLAVRGDGTKAWSLTIGSMGITAAPAVGERAIWVGTREGELRLVALDGSAVLGGVGLATGGAVDGAVGVWSLPEKEWGFVTSASGRLGAASTTLGETATTRASLPMQIGPVIDRSGHVCGVSSALRCYAFDGAFDLPNENALSGAASGALAVDSGDGILTIAGDPGVLSRNPPGGVPTPVVTHSGSVFADSLVVARDGDLIVGDQDGVLRRFSAAGVPRWTQPPVCEGVPNASLLLTESEMALISTTRGGRLYAISDQGSVTWETALGGDLRAPNIHTPPGQPAGTVLSTAYVSSASGKLYAVIVDGELDTSAPWPKAFHDPRNTNNAGTLP